MRCCDVEALWDEMRDGVEPRREHVLAHLRTCPPCQALYQSYEGVAYCLTCLPPVEPPASMVPRILDHIRTVVRRAQSPDNVGRVPSPIGELVVAFRSTGITYVGLARTEGAEQQLERIERRLRRPLVAAAAPQWVRDTIDRYFRTFITDYEHVDISDLTPFEQAALRKAAEIPAGEVRSYGWVAKEIGQPTAARAVGQVMARNPVALLFPCHRVVDATGALHNYGYGVDVKARILEMEGYVAERREYSVHTTSAAPSETYQ